MKKMALTTLIMMFTLNLLAPDYTSLCIQEAEATKPYQKLIYAVGMVETRLDTLAYNPHEQAAGYFQIRPIRIAHYNKLTGESLTTKDMFDYDIAERVFIYFANRIGPYNMEKIAKDWNGSGPMTIEYWKLIQTNL